MNFFSQRIVCVGTFLGFLFCASTRTHALTWPEVQNLPNCGQVYEEKYPASSERKLWVFNNMVVTTTPGQLLARIAASGFVSLNFLTKQEQVVFTRYLDAHQTLILTSYSKGFGLYILKVNQDQVEFTKSMLVPIVRTIHSRQIFGPLLDVWFNSQSGQLWLLSPFLAWRMSIDSLVQDQDIKPDRQFELPTSVEDNLMGPRPVAWFPTADIGDNSLLLLIILQNPESTAPWSQIQGAIDPIAGVLDVRAYPFPNDEVPHYTLRLYDPNSKGEWGGLAVNQLMRQTYKRTYWYGDYVLATSAYNSYRFVSFNNFGTILMKGNNPYCRAFTARMVSNLVFLQNTGTGYQLVMLGVTREGNLLKAVMYE